MYKHILLASDLSNVDSGPEKKAVELAKLNNAKLSVVHTIEPIPAYGYPGLVDLQSPYIEEARSEMEKLGRRSGIATDDQHIEFGSVKIQVMKVAEELGVDLIVIGSHGRHGFGRLLGSGASSIIHHANCDVLTIRHVEA